MKWLAGVQFAVLAFLAGNLGSLILISTVDESASLWVHAGATCAVLIPMAGALGYASAKTVWLSCPAMLSGVFVGVCATLLILFPDSANLFPFVAVIWTVMAFVPIVVGFLVGRIWKMRTPS